MSLDASAFEYLKPTEAQLTNMAVVREAAKAYASVLEANLPDGADKTFVLRSLRNVAMWANIAITRESDGSPRA